MTYIDLDLQFSSLLQNLDQAAYDRLANSRKLVVLQPPDDVLELVELIASQKMQKGGILILDSLNSLQNILTEDGSKQQMKAANQKTALIVSILQMISRSYGDSLIVVNVAKSRPRSSEEKDSGHWDKKLVGGRMIKFKSDLILSVEEVKGNPSKLEIVVEGSKLRKGEGAADRERRYQMTI